MSIHNMSRCCGYYYYYKSSSRTAWNSMARRGGLAHGSSSTTAVSMSTLRWYSPTVSSSSSSSSQWSTSTTIMTCRMMMGMPYQTHVLFQLPSAPRVYSSRASSSTSGATESTTASSSSSTSTTEDPEFVSSEPTPPTTDDDHHQTHDTTTTTEEPAAVDHDANHETTEPVEEDANVAATRKQSQQLRELKDALLRSLAEQENTRTIAKRDVEQARQFAIKSFAKSLLEVADNLQRALESVPPEFRPPSTTHPTTTTPTTIHPDIFQTLYQGIEMTEKGLKKALDNHGVVPFGTVGEDFDPHRHEALYEYPSNDADATTTPSNHPTVGVVMKCGYTLHARVLRPAEVGVVKPKSSSSQ